MPISATLSNFRYTHAIVSSIPESLAAQALRSDADVVVDMNAARLEHRRYVTALESLGLVVLKLPSDEKLPDCVFVEDPVVVAGGKAFLTRPGAKERLEEARKMKSFLEKSSMRLKIIDTCQEHATIDGGDVLFTGAEFFVGVSDRTNREGIAALAAAFPEFPVHGITVDAGLHLKSFCSMAAPGVVLIGSSEAASSAKRQMLAASTSLDFVVVPHDAAANCVVVGDVILHRSRDEFPESVDVIEERFRDQKRISLTNTELAKVDGALTCCSVLIDASEGH